MPLLQIRITLEDVEPEVWRVLEIGGDRRLSEVHDALQIALGWTDSHLHLFEHPDGRRWASSLVDDALSDGDEQAVTLFQAMDAGSLRYEYDFGDSWSHRIVLVDSTSEKTDRVALVDGARSVPPEDCGGAPGYEDLLAALADPAAADHEVLTAWATQSRLPWKDAGPFDPEAFDVDAVNRRLRRRFDPGHLTASWGPHLREVANRFTPGALTALGDHLERADLASPVDFDEDVAARVVRPFSWLLDHVGDAGLKLTAAGRLPPSTVRAAGQALGWDRYWIGAMNREDNVPMASHLREWATKTGLVRRYSGTLLLGRAGAATREDPAALLHQVASRALQVAPKGVEREAGVLLLVELAAGVKPDRHELSERVAFGLHLAGYVGEDRWSAPSAESALFLVREVWNLLAMLSLVTSEDGDLIPGSEATLRHVARVALREV